MRYVVVLFAVALAAVPVFAQQDDELALHDLGMFSVFASYSFGNLALADIQRGNDPLEQYKRFFNQSKLPLSSAQEKQLSRIIDDQVKVLVAAKDDQSAVRRANAEYTRKVNDTLTADQRAELRRYRTEQIMLRGGFPALKLVLENGNAPFTEEQETGVQAIYLDFNQKANALAREAKGNPDRAQLTALENEALGKVVRLLTPTQRAALAASRQGPVHAHVKP